MTILYANVIEQNIGWGAEVFLNNAWRQNGHKTVLIDYRKNRSNLYNKVSSTIKNQNIDCLFLQRGDYVPLDFIKSFKVPKFFWNSELVRRRKDNHHILASSEFSHVFVRTQRCKDEILTNGWKTPAQIDILLGAFDALLHKKKENIKKDIDVLFVGGITERRQQWLSKISQICSLKIASAFGEEMVQLFNSAKIILNIHAEDELDTETRVYEVLGCGGFLLTETLSEENPFIDNKHLVTCNNVNEMVDKVQYYLNNNSERENIAWNGYKEAQLRHSYQVRSIEIISVLQQYLPLYHEKEQINKNYLNLLKWKERAGVYKFNQKLFEKGYIKSI